MTEEEIDKKKKKTQLKRYAGRRLSKLLYCFNFKYLLPFLYTIFRFQSYAL